MAEPLQQINNVRKDLKTMTPKKIAVLGGGNGAHTMAAELTLKGHTVNMFEVPEWKHNMQKVFDTQTITVKGVLNGTAKLNMVTDNIAEAVEGCDGRQEPQ